jgi:hypothetical protein
MYRFSSRADQPSSLRSVRCYSSDLCCSSDSRFSRRRASAVPSGPARRQGRHRIEPIEGLNRRFLISRKDHRVLRRLQVQPEHIGRLLVEVGVIRGHIRFEPMRLQARAAPDAEDQHVTDPERAFANLRAPMRAASGGRCRVLAKTRASIAGVRRSPVGRDTSRGARPAVRPETAASTGSHSQGITPVPQGERF